MYLPTIVAESMFTPHGIIVSCIIGLIIGVIAKLLLPGRDPEGCIVTMLIGIAGSFLGTWLGKIFFGSSYVAGWIVSILGAMILLYIHRIIVQKKGP